MATDMRTALRKALERAQQLLRAKQRKNPKYAPLYDNEPYSILKETKQYAKYLQFKYNRVPPADILAVSKLYAKTLVLTRQVRSFTNGATNVNQAAIARKLELAFQDLRQGLKAMAKKQRREARSHPDDDDI